MYEYTLIIKSLTYNLTGKGKTLETADPVLTDKKRLSTVYGKALSCEKIRLILL